jgi:hypothetical protein
MESDLFAFLKDPNLIQNIVLVVVGYVLAFLKAKFPGLPLPTLPPVVPTPAPAPAPAPVTPPVEPVESKVVKIEERLAALEAKK